ncbi:MAG: hypothetical protein JEZ08_22755 [Clostridiales bacterium]|nr:hypothetical protein [Clostridiales bacterium]
MHHNCHRLQEVDQTEVIVLIGNGWVISMTEGVIPIDEKNYMMPIWAI